MLMITIETAAGEGFAAERDGAGGDGAHVAAYASTRLGRTWPAGLPPCSSLMSFFRENLSYYV